MKNTTFKPFCKKTQAILGINVNDIAHVYRIACFKAEERDEIRNAILAKDLYIRLKFFDGEITFRVSIKGEDNSLLCITYKRIMQDLNKI